MGSNPPAESMAASRAFLFAFHSEYPQVCVLMSLKCCCPLRFVTLFYELLLKIFLALLSSFFLFIGVHDSLLSSEHNLSFLMNGFCVFLFLKASLGLFVRVSCFLAFNQAFLDKRCALAPCFRYDIFQWCPWCLQGFNSFSSSFYLHFNRLSHSCVIFLWKFCITVVDFLAFVTSVGLLYPNTLLECLFSRQFLNKILHAFQY